MYANALIPPDRHDNLRQLSMIPVSGSSIV